jgi:hypothetical protein
MASTQPHVRELAERTSSGTRVRLLWRGGTRQLWVELSQGAGDEALAILVPPERALDAFHHPYAYARAQRLESPAESRAGSRTRNARSARKSHER